MTYSMTFNKPYCSPLHIAPSGSFDPKPYTLNKGGYTIPFSTPFKEVWTTVHIVHFLWSSPLGLQENPCPPSTASQRPTSLNPKPPTYMGVSQNYGYLFGGPNNKDYSILGSILGSPYFGKLPYSTKPEEPLDPIVQRLSILILQS